MKFIVTGSGGCVCTPKPLCQCPVCVEARAKGYPYARCGCSLYLEDAHLLVDTPEDIAVALNNADIRAVDHILYSHWDPDHTLGMRVMEQLRLEWLDYYEGIGPRDPVIVHAREGVMEDICAIRSKYGSLLLYYEQMGLIQKHIVEDSIVIDEIQITIIPVASGKAVSVFIFESGGKKLVYAPCDCVPFPRDERIIGADALVVGNTFIGDALKGGRRIGPNHPLRKELHAFEDVLAIKSEMGIREVVLTHIEEDWGKSYDDYRALEAKHSGVRFAFDGMVIEV